MPVVAAPLPAYNEESYVASVSVYLLRLFDAATR
jgi:hypothetical protein